jgi:hypothetical protein
VSVVKAVEVELASLAKRDKPLSESAIAATALAMAREIDEAGNSATSKSMCAARLQEAMDRLRELAPAAQEANKVDELRAKRERRRAKAAG